MMMEEALNLARERAGRLRVDPQVTICELYEAVLLGRLQKLLRGALVWKGGAVLRLEGSERFSRDLDATRRVASLTASRLAGRLHEAGHDLAYLAAVELQSQPRSLAALYRFTLPGLRHPLRVTVEVSLREKILRPPAAISTARIAHPVGLEPVVVPRLESGELLAEKVRALVMRLAGRDIYDVYWLLQRGVEFDPSLFVRKMLYYARIGAPAHPATVLERAIRRIESYDASRARTELANLLPASQRKLDFDVIVADVRLALTTWLGLLAPPGSAGR